MGRIISLLSQILEAQSEIWPTDPGRTHYLHVNVTHRLCNVLQNCNRAKYSSFNLTYEVGTTCRNCCAVKVWKLWYLTGLWPTEDDWKNNNLLTLLCSLTTFFISSTLIPIPFIVCSFVASLSVPSLLQLLRLKQLPLPPFPCHLPFRTLNYFSLPLYFFSMLSFARPITISLPVSCRWHNILPCSSVYSQWQKIVSAFPTSWTRWVVNSPEDGCNCYYFASTVHWIKLPARKITNVKFALHTAPALYQKTMFTQLSKRIAHFSAASRTTSFRNFIMLRQNVICLDKYEMPNIRSLYAFGA